MSTVRPSSDANGTNAGSFPSQAQLVPPEQGNSTASRNQQIIEKRQLADRPFHAQRLEDIGLLSAGIIHDLNNVLTPVLMAVPMVAAHITDPEGLKLLAMIEENVNRGAGLVRQILAFAHRSNGESQAQKIQCLIRDLSQVIQETFPKTISYETCIAEDLWAVEGDPIQIYQVLLNLCINARDAMPEGGTLRLSAENYQLDELGAALVSGGRPGAFVCLRVQDTGTGMAPEVLARIWEPFYTTKEPFKGTGLGLPTVRAIVEGHKGFISLESLPGQGTTFGLWLPAATSCSPVASSPRPSGIGRGNGELILVVDDEDSIRRLANIVLTKQGYRVLTAGDGAEASTLFSRNYNEISLVVTDLNMPNLDGRALVKYIRQINPTIKILAIGGAGQVFQMETSNGENPVAFLAKPFQLEQFLSEVNRLLPAGSANT